MRVHGTCKRFSSSATLTKWNEKNSLKTRHTLTSFPQNNVNVNSFFFLLFLFLSLYTRGKNTFQTNLHFIYTSINSMCFFIVSKIFQFYSYQLTLLIKKLKYQPKKIICHKIYYCFISHLSIIRLSSRFPIY